jgi:hypothetical protein
MVLKAGILLELMRTTLKEGYNAFLKFETLGYLQIVQRKTWRD